MLIIRREQLDALNAPVQSRFEAETLAHLGRYYPTDMELLGEAGLLAVIRAGQRGAMALGFTLAGDARRFITLSMVLGGGFLRDPLLPWAARILEEAPGESATVDRLAEEAAAYLELISGKDGQYALRAMLRAVALSFDEVIAGGDEDAYGVTLVLLNHVWPQKFRLLEPERRAGFLRAAAAKAAADGLDTPGTARVYTLFMFLLGAGFASDPAIPWARAALASARDAPALARARALSDAGLAAVEALRAVLLAES